MKVQFTESFLKDLEALGDSAIRKRVRKAIAQAEQAATFKDIRNLKKLKGGDEYYRIRIGDYRLGLVCKKTPSFSFDACTVRTSTGISHECFDFLTRYFSDQ